MNDLADVAVGTELPGLELPFTRADLVRYAGASGDLNPIHWSDRAARQLGLDGVIAHGMLTMGRALRVVTDWVGDPGRVASYAVRFARPVPVPDDDAGVTVSVSAVVTAVTDELVTVGLEAHLGEARVLGSGVVEVRRG